jgi:hypothetical protein
MKTTADQRSEPNQMIRRRLDNLNETTYHSPRPIQKSAAGYVGWSSARGAKHRLFYNESKPSLDVGGCFNRAKGVIKSVNSVNPISGKASTPFRSIEKLLSHSLMQAILLCKQFSYANNSRNWNAKSLKTHTSQTMITADIEAGAPNTDAAMPTADVGMRTSDARIPASG